MATTVGAMPQEEDNRGRPRVQHLGQKQGLQGLFVKSLRN